MRATVIFLLVVLSGAACAQELARVEGVVKDANTGKSLSGALVEIYKVGGSTHPVNSTVTDDSGYYSFFVEPMAFYDVYVRFQGASDSFKTPEAVRPGSVNKVNIAIRTGDSNPLAVTAEKAGFGVVIIASIIVLALVIWGFLKQNKKLNFEDLSREREQVKMELEVLRKKYHRREIAEEQLNAISKDKQQQLVEIESKMIKMAKAGK